MKSLSTRYFLTSSAILTACLMTPQDLSGHADETLQIAMQGVSLHCLVASCIISAQKLGALYSLPAVSYLHLRYLCNRKHATDEETREDVVMHKILSNPDLHLKAHSGHQQVNSMT